jgi:hypothetical protein
LALDAGALSQTVTTDKNTSGSTRTVQAFCSYWNTSREAWIVDERAGVANMTGDTIVCPFNHLTDFAAFIGEGVKVNAPCFNCWSDFITNPFALVVVAILGGILLVNFIVSIAQYRRYSKMTPEEILEQQYAKERKRVLAPDYDLAGSRSENNTSCCEDMWHRIRHDIATGGIFCPIPGDPFDRSQRVLVIFPIQSL